MVNESIFVCGVTGNQGAQVARQLLRSGVAVHAVTRQPSSSVAQTLEGLGVKLWHANFDQEDVLRNAISGTCAVFLNFTPDFTDLDANLRHAQAILRIAEETATVRQVVYSSSVAVDESLHSPLVEPQSLLYRIFESKVLIEQAVRSSNLPNWTILRPGNFMSNYVNPTAAVQLRGLAETGFWKTANQRSDAIPLVDTRTIGHFASEALLHPERFKDKTITLADEILPMGEILSRVASVAGRNLQMVPMTSEEIEKQRSVNPFIGGQLLMGSSSKYVDLDEVKKWNVPLSTFDEFLKREHQAVMETYQAST